MFNSYIHKAESLLWIQSEAKAILWMRTFGYLLCPLLILSVVKNEVPGSIVLYMCLRAPCLILFLLIHQWVDGSTLVSGKKDCAQSSRQPLRSCCMLWLQGFEMLHIVPARVLWCLREWHCFLNITCHNKYAFTLI